MKRKKRKTLTQKIKNFMAGFDIDELMSIKNNYQGNRFQWIKTSDTKKLGTVVTVVDVVPGKRMNTVNGVVQRYGAHLSDGTTIDTEQLNSDLMMLHDDQPAMSMAEIMSINQSVATIDGDAIKSSLPTELQELSTISDLTKNTPDPVSKPDAPIQPQNTMPQNRPSQASVDTTSLFGMFSVEDTVVSLKISTKLPAKNLLKMMYSNSQDKDKFVNQLSAYINNSITQEAIEDSVRTMMGHDKKKKPDELQQE